MIVTDLQSGLMRVAEKMVDESQDNRFQSWAKFIDSVDPRAKNGYAFEGGWINDGTIEVDMNGPRLALVMFRHGSRNYNYAEYAVVKIDTDGTLATTGIMTGNDRGWALRIRDLVIAELASLTDGPPINPLAGFTAEQLQAELDRRNG